MDASHRLQWGVKEVILPAGLHRHNFMLQCTEVKGKQNTTAIRPVHLVGTRLTPEIKSAFELVAAAQNRSVSGELRHMIERRVEDFSEAEKASA